MELNLRIPNKLYEDLKKEASERGMTVNEYIAAILEDRVG